MEAQRLWAALWLGSGRRDDNGSSIINHKRPCILYHGSAASYGFECLMVVWLGGVTVGSDVIDATE